MQQKTQAYIDQARDFVRDYTAGLNVRDFKRLFDKDAVEAYAVLARDQETDPHQKDGFRRFLQRVRVVFLGVSSKLSPTRRALFAIALLTAILGLINPSQISFGVGTRDVELDFSPLYFVVSIGALFFLLVVELVDRVRVRDELEVARQLQADLLPQASPDLPGYSFAHSYRTANEVGGDYYDFPVLPDGRLAIMVGDASGHGIAAGLLMAIANATLKTALDVDPDPQRVAALLNGTLYRTGDRRAFMTLFYGRLEPATGRFDYVCAGHPFPLLRRAGGQIEELGQGTLPLGMRPDLEVPTGSTSIEPGDTLVLFTDGLPEAIDGPDGDSFGFERLNRLLATVGSAASLHDRILQAFDSHVGHEALTDDLTLVVLTRG